MLWSYCYLLLNGLVPFVLLNGISMSNAPESGSSLMRGSSFSDLQFWSTSLTFSLFLLLFGFDGASGTFSIVNSITFVPLAVVVLTLLNSVLGGLRVLFGAFLVVYGWSSPRFRVITGGLLLERDLSLRLGLVFWFFVLVASIFFIVCFLLSSDKTPASSPGDVIVFRLTRAKGFCSMF